MFYIPLGLSLPLFSLAWKGLWMLFCFSSVMWVLNAECRWVSRKCGQHVEFGLIFSFVVLNFRFYEFPAWLFFSSFTKINSLSGELARFQAGVTLEISRLDAWYSSANGSLDGPATYIVRGLCRKCCIPEIFLRSMQVIRVSDYVVPVLNSIR